MSQLAPSMKAVLYLQNMHEPPGQILFLCLAPLAMKTVATIEIQSFLVVLDTVSMAEKYILAIAPKGVLN